MSTVKELFCVPCLENVDGDHANATIHMVIHASVFPAFLELKEENEKLKADQAAPIKRFTGAEVNQAGWVCGACEPGDYATCDDCQSAADDVAQFVNRLTGGTK